MQRQSGVDFRSWIDPPFARHRIGLSEKRADLLECRFTILNAIAEKLTRQSKDDFKGWQSGGFPADRKARSCCRQTLLALEQARADIAWRRRRWSSLQGRLDPNRLVFIDETWIKTNMAPLRGWALKGKRLRSFAPHGHWRTLTFLGALRCDGLTAPCVFDGPINGVSFKAYVAQILLPSLKPGDIVIMDNLGSHKASSIRRIIQSAGARLWFLPPYSPDLNPIEQAFSKIKHWMRNAQQRSAEETWRHVGKLVQSIKPIEYQNYFKNAGYEPT